MTLNGVMAVTLRYFTEFDKLVFRHIGRAATASICGGISSYARVYCIGRVSYLIYVSMRHYVLTTSGDIVVCFHTAVCLSC